MTNNIRFPKSITAVRRPDHPFAYDGPDLLLSSPSGLLGVFGVRKSESSGPTHLLTRLMNTVLVYPPSMKLVLYLERDDSTDLHPVFSKGFTRIIEKRDLRISNTLLREQISNNRLKPLGDIQQRIFRMQAEKEAANMDYLKRVKFKFSKSEVLLPSRLKQKASYRSPIHENYVSSRSSIFEYEERIIATKKLSPKRSDMVELRPFFEFSLLRDFDYQNGLPYPGDMSGKVINLDKIPVSRYDPLKPIRVASLLGWSISNSNTIRQLLQHF